MAEQMILYGPPRKRPQRKTRIKYFNSAPGANLRTRNTRDTRKIEGAMKMALNKEKNFWIDQFYRADG
jgi:hypothetical protein